MCFGATCSTCSKKSWRGCGSHIPQALSGVAEENWCTCDPKVTVDGKEYPPAAKMAIPGASFFSSLLGGGGAKTETKPQEKTEAVDVKKDEL